MTWHTIHTVFTYKMRFNSHLGETEGGGKNHPGFFTQNHMPKTDQLLLNSIQNLVISRLEGNRNLFLYEYHSYSIKKEQKHL